MSGLSFNLLTGKKVFVMRLLLLTGFGVISVVGFADASPAEQQFGSAAAFPVAVKSTEVAAIPASASVLNDDVGNPVEIAPPGTVNDPHAIIDSIATHMPRRLQLSENP